MSRDSRPRFDVEQYGRENPNGYNCANGTGVACPIGLGVRAESLGTR